MFSKEIDDLFNGNNFEVLKILSQYNPDIFKDNVHSLSDKGYSFFIKLISKSSDVDYVKNILELCESFGYNFVETKRNYHEDDSYKLLHPKNTKNSYNYGFPDVSNKRNPEFTPEYIFAFSHADSDGVIHFLTEKMGKEKMLELEKNGWPILEYAYRKNYFKTIKLLSDYGFDYDNPPSGVNILDIAKDDLKLIDLFWKIKNEKEDNNSEFMTDGQFTQFYNLFEKNIKSINTKKDYISESIIKNIDEKKDFLSKDHKEKLLIKSLLSPDDRAFKHLVKLLKYKQKSEEINNIILKNLDNVARHDILYWLIEDNTYLFKKIESESNEKPIYGIDKIVNKLSKMDVSLLTNYTSNKNKQIINNSFTERFKLIFKNDSLLLKELDNGVTLFDKIVINDSSKGNLFKFLNISPKKSIDSSNSLLKNLSLEQFEQIKSGNTELTSEQKLEIRDLLSKTWLKKDSDGKTNLDKCGIYYIAHTDTFLFDSIFMEDNTIYSNDMKMSFFNKLVEQHAGSYIFSKSPQTWVKNSDETGTYKLLKNLYFILSKDPETKWSNLELSEKAIKDLRNNEFLFELRARQMSEDLNSNLSTTNKTTKYKLKL